jgi:hypothetical protein
MPFKITFTVVKPEDSTALWPYELDHETLNQDKTNWHEDWASQQPGFIDRSSTWITPGFVYEKIYIFDTRENCDAFIIARRAEQVQSTKLAYFREHGFTTSTEIVEI